MSSQTQLVVRVALATFGAWSLGTLVVVEAGLGSRYSLHPPAAEDESQVPSLSLVQGQQLLGPLEAYASIGERPLFNHDRRPLPAPEADATAAPVAPPPTPLNVVLTSVVLMGDVKLAIVNDPSTNKGQTLRIGRSLEGDQSAWKLVELEPRRAVFEGPTGRTALDLRVFDGQGGEPPTPVALAQPDPNTGGGMVVQESPETAGAADTPESRAEQIRRRIEERRRQMREEAERANAERGK